MSHILTSLFWRMREYIYYLVGFTQIKCMSGEIYRTDTLVIVWKINAYFAKVHQEISCNNCNNRTIKSNLIKLTKICYIIKAYCCLDKSLTGALAAKPHGSLFPQHPWYSLQYLFYNHRHFTKNLFQYPLVNTIIIKCVAGGGGGGTFLPYVIFFSFARSSLI